MINLLSQEEKDFLTQEEKFKVTLILNVLVFVFFISLCLILFAVRTYLWGQSEAQKIILEQAQQEFKESETEDLQEQISSLNVELSKLKSYYKTQVSNAGVLDVISEKITDGVYFTGFSLEPVVAKKKEESGLKVSIGGRSVTREDLFKFKKNLEKESSFKQISFPPSNWIKPTGAEFYEFKISFQIQ